MIIGKEQHDPVAESDAVMREKITDAVRAVPSGAVTF
jgi:uncharacterized Fe-S cluster protein YjdI